jgi:hypothetical protein
MDATGSMASHIKTAKTQIQGLRDQIASSVRGASCTFGCVAYKDPLEGDAPAQTLDFTPNPRTFSSFLADVKAGGGGDGAEDVHSGLEAAAALSWSPQVGVRLLYHIADAPSHGTLFNGGVNDNHAYFDSDGSLTQGTLHLLQVQGLSQYFFLKINSCTDTMIAKYSEFMNKPIITKEIASAADMMVQIAKTTIESISSSMKETELRSVATRAADEKSFVSVMKQASLTILRTPFARTVPMISISEGSGDADEDGPSVPEGTVQVKVFTCKLPVSKGDIKRPITLTRKAKIRHFQFGTSQIAKGGVRGVRTATDVTFDPHVSSVLKYHLKARSDFHEARRNVVHDVQTQTMAAFLAREFSALSQVKKRVSYLKASLVEYDEGGGNRVGQLERFMDLKGASDFVKWSNNGDFARSALDPEYSATLNAFSHWTYEVSNHYLVLVDVQGKKQDSKTYILTDPAIHCTDMSRFGVTNFGAEGIDSFLAAHVCNSLCRSLGLSCTTPDVMFAEVDTLVEDGTL